MAFEFIRRAFYKLLVISFALIILMRNLHHLTDGKREWLLLSDGTFVGPDWTASLLESFKGLKPVMSVRSDQCDTCVILNIITAIMMLCGVLTNKVVLVYPGLVVASMNLQQDWSFVLRKQPFDDRISSGNQLNHNFMNVSFVIMGLKSALVYATLRFLRQMPRR